MKISILDYSIIDKNKTPIQALLGTVELVQTAEKLGYNRFWVSEHHDVPAYAGSSPEILITHLIGKTNTIRLGSGGVMLPHYSTFKIAENFKLLETLAPRRIDLGIGFTVGTKQVYQTLNENKSRITSKEVSVTDLQYFLTQSDTDHRFKDTKANPQVETLPELHLLSTSSRSAKLAARHGISFTLGLFPNISNYTNEMAIDAINTYKYNFSPSTFSKQSHVMLAIFVCVADTLEQAEEFAKVLDIWLLGKNDFKQFKTFPTIDDVYNFDFTDEDLEKLKSQRNNVIIGDKKMAKEKLTNILKIFKADEIMIIPAIPDLKNRLRALEIMSEVVKEY